MKLFPHERLILRSSESPEAVVARLIKMVAPGWFYLCTPPQPFRGRVSGQQFKIVRLPVGRRGLRFHTGPPVLVGEIVPVAEGSEVRVTMRLHAAVAVFIGVWFALWCSGLASIVLAELQRGSALLVPGFLAAAAMGAFAVAFVRFSFWFEAKKASALLREGLECAEETAPQPLDAPK